MKTTNRKSIAIALTLSIALTFALIAPPIVDASEHGIIQEITISIPGKDLEITLINVWDKTVKFDMSTNKEFFLSDGGTFTLSRDVEVFGGEDGSTDTLIGILEGGRQYTVAQYDSAMESFRTTSNCFTYYIPDQFDFNSLSGLESRLRNYESCGNDYSMVDTVFYSVSGVEILPEVTIEIPNSGGTQFTLTNIYSSFADEKGVYFLGYLPETELTCSKELTLYERTASNTGERYYAYGTPDFIWPTEGSAIQTFPAATKFTIASMKEQRKPDSSLYTYPGYITISVQDESGMNKTSLYFTPFGKLIERGEYDDFHWFIPVSDIAVVVDSTDAYIYDEPDPGASTDLPLHLLDGITDQASAIDAIQTAAQGLTAEQKQSATGIDLVTLFAEETIARAASTSVTGGNITIDQSAITALQTEANTISAAAEQTLSTNGVTIQRDIQADIRFATNTTANVTITIDPSAAATTADNVRVETPNYAITLSAEAIKENTGATPLIITITETGAIGGLSAIPAHANAVNRVSGMPGQHSLHTDSSLLVQSTMMLLSDTNTYTITFDKPVTENVKVSLPPASGDPTYQAITDSNGNAVGGKLNPVTNKLEAMISTSDTYTVKDNRINFSDVSNKSREMQNAINILASKGIINGTTATTFSPDGTITRAEIAALIVRTLSKLDPNADGGFTDVGRSDWYFSAVGSAKRHGIVNGTSPTTFAPRSNIQKDQIVAICARTLRAEMRYRSPSNVSAILSAYTDYASIAQWGHEDIALATRENLVVRRTDGRFNGSATMTRGDAAIILYRMFMKIW